VHDLSEDFDPDEFEGLDEAQGISSFSSSSAAAASDENDDDLAFAEPQQDEEGEEEGLSTEEEEEEEEVAGRVGARGGWSESESGEDFADDEFGGRDGDDGDDDDDDEFGGFDDEFDVAPKKKKKKKVAEKPRGSNKKGRDGRRSRQKKKSPKAQKKTSSASSSSSDTSSAKTTPPNAVPAGPRWGMPEMFGLACVLLYGVVYFAGSAMNERKASKWIAAFYPIVSQQFHMVGENLMDTSGELDARTYRTLLTKESQSHYRLYASGRENADALIANLELDARQDLFYLLWGLVTSTQDMLTIDIPMDGSRMHPFIMAVLPVVEATSIVGSEYCSDIKALAREIKAAQQYLPPHLVLYSDCNFNEILALLPSKSGSAAASAASAGGGSMSTMDFLSSPLFHSMHFTDQNAKALPSVALNNVVALKNLRFRFKLPRDSNKMSELVPLLRFAVGHYIDRVARFTLSPKAKTKAIGIRNKLRSVKKQKLGTEEREERLAQRKEEKEKARKEKLEKMNPRDREKFMEKEAARLRKKRMKKSGGKIRVAM
jgi:hypothetical protein